MTGRIKKTELIAKLRQLEGLTDDERNSLIDLLTRQKRYGLVWEDKTEDVEESLRDHLPVLREVKERRIIGQAGGEADKPEGLNGRQAGGGADKPEGLLRAQAGGEAERNPCEADRTTNQNPERVAEHSAAPSGLSYSATVAGVGTPACSLESPSGTCPNHIIIEGDNLEALTALSYTHEGKIDVIYIDPPYNTGNKDFVYNDSFVDSEDSYRHSKWLSFMEKRLKIAKTLLSDKGVIFISIDNNEFASLKLLCDEVFLEKNFVEVLKWKRKKQPSFLARHTASVMEYVLVYARDYYLLDKLSIEGASDATKKVLNISNGESQRHFKQGVRVKLDGNGLIKAGSYTNKTMSIRFLQDVRYSNNRTSNAVDVIGRFLDSQDRIDMFIDRDLLFITANIGLRRDVSEEEKGRRKSITDLLLDWGDNQDSELEQRMLFGEIKFDYAKPCKLIFNLIKSYNSDTSTILDFFAGSGTTLHATMQLNAEDGGHRQCILVTNNENGICEQVTYERNKRVIQGYTTPKGEQVAGLTRNNLRYYRTELLPRTMTFKARQELMRASADLLCIKEDIYSERREFGGMKFRPSLLRYFREADGRQMLLVFDERAVAHVVPLIERLEGRLKVYVFSNGPYAYEDEFARVKERVELCALPEALLQVYRKVLPKGNEEEVRI